jgi:peptidoglycan/LPS O-acetylase OafA/YrhL
VNIQLTAVDQVDVAQTKHKIVFIHILRSIAPLFVLLAHVPGLWLLERHETWRWYSLYQATILAPLRLSDGGGQFGVILFFLISGYIMSHTALKETRAEFLVKRVFRIFPALMLCTLIAFALVKLSAHYNTGPIYSTDAETPLDFLKSSLMLSWIVPSPRAISVAWSLMPELIFYSMVLLLLPGIRGAPVKSTIWMILLYAALTFPMAAFGYLSYLGFFTVYLPVFFVGRILYLQHYGYVSSKQSIALLAVTTALFLSVYTNRFPDELFRVNGARIWNYPIAIAIFYGLMISDIRWCPKVISFFGDISYSLYLVHLPVGIFILNVTASWNVPFALKVSLAIAAPVVASAMIYRFLERPAQAYARLLTASSRKT